MDKDPFKYQHKDQSDMDAGRPLSYHTPAIKREKARRYKSEALKKKRENEKLKNTR
jgi:hypothetical protein